MKQNDTPLNKKLEKQRLLYRHGKESSGGVYVFGAVLPVIGVALFISEIIYLESIPLVIIGLTILLSYSGIIIDLNGNRYKYYVWVLGLKVGKWRSLSEYGDLLVLRRKRSTGYNFNGITMARLSSVEYELLFANSNHLRQVLISKYDDIEEAYEEAGRLEKITQREFVQFNPGMKFPRKNLP